MSASRSISGSSGCSRQFHSFIGVNPLQTTWTEHGIVSGREALLLRSAEIQPLLPRFSDWTFVTESPNPPTTPFPTGSQLLQGGLAAAAILGSQPSIFFPSLHRACGRAPAGRRPIIGRPRHQQHIMEIGRRQEFACREGITPDNELPISTVLRPPHRSGNNERATPTPAWLTKAGGRPCWSANRGCAYSNCFYSAFFSLTAEMYFD